MPKKTKHKFNRAVHSFVFAQEKLHIDIDCALQYWAEYVQAVNLVSIGQEDAFSLMYSEKRKSEMLRAVSRSEGVYSAYQVNSGSDIPQGSVAHLKMSGAMRLDGGISSRGIKSLCRDFRAMAANPNIIATVFEVNSGGGESIAGQELKNAIIDSEKAGTPVIVYGQTVGSAALDGVLPATKIFAAGPDSQFGSIGSYIPTSKAYRKFFNKNFEDVYATVSPDKNKAFREWLKGNNKPLEEKATASAERFQSEVLKYRELNPSKKENTLKGGMFPAREAIDRGLADGIKTLNEVYDFAFNLTNDHDSNQSDMNFRESIISACNAIFGTSWGADTSEEDIVNSLTGMKPISEQVSSAVAAATVALNQQFQDLQNSMNSMKGELEQLRSQVGESSENAPAVNEQIENLKAEIETLKADKTNLEQTVAELQGNSEGGNEEDNTGVPSQNKAFDDFQKQLDTLTVAGDSKY